MQAHSLPAQRGWAWIVDGFALWRRNPALITFLVFGYWFVLLVISAVPLIGQVLMSLVMPALSMGILNGCKATAEGRKVGPEILLSGFRHNLPELVKIGGLYLIGTLAVLGLTMLADDGVLAELMLGQRKFDEDSAEDPRLALSLTIGLLFSTPLMMAYWFAPLLASWGRVPAAKAMFFSLVACWRNWRAFFIYSVGLMGAVMIPGLLIGLLSSLSPVLGILPALALPLVFLPVVFASFYANAVDVFGSIQAEDEH
jgi:hypothetical protein